MCLHFSTQMFSYNMKKKSGTVMRNGSWKVTKSVPVLGPMDMGCL